MSAPPNPLYDSVKVAEEQKTSLSHESHPPPQVENMLKKHKDEEIEPNQSAESSSDSSSSDSSSSDDSSDSSSSSSD